MPGQRELAHMQKGGVLLHSRTELILKAIQLSAMIQSQKRTVIQQKGPGPIEKITLTLWYVLLPMEMELMQRE